MPTKKNLIVFDIDDTLTKSEDQHLFAYTQAMKDFGITEINENWKGYTHHTDSHILKENYERNFKDAFSFSFIDRFEAKMAAYMLESKKVEEIKGAKAVIEYLLTETEYAISMATGSLLKPAFIKLNQARIKIDEQLVVGANSIYDREGIVTEAIKRAEAFYQVEKFEHIISVGDGLWDLQTARNLGVHFIGIGMKNYADFEKEKIKVHIKDWTTFNLNNTLVELGL